MICARVSAPPGSSLLILVCRDPDNATSEYRCGEIVEATRVDAPPGGSKVIESSTQCCRCWRREIADDLAKDPREAAA